MKKEKAKKKKVVQEKCVERDTHIKEGIPS